MSATREDAALPQPPNRPVSGPVGPKWINLPARFSVTVPDDALAPRLVRGYGVVLDSTKTPRDGDGVCVVTCDDEAYLRIYRETRDGFFEAVPLNPAYSWPRLDSKLDTRLRVAGVLVSTLCVDDVDCQDDEETVSLRYLCLAAAPAWRRASEEAREEGRQFSDLDCYGYLGARPRGELQ